MTSNLSHLIFDKIVLKDETAVNLINIVKNNLLVYFYLFLPKGSNGSMNLFLVTYFSNFRADQTANFQIEYLYV